MWLKVKNQDELQEGDIIELGTEYPLLLHYAVVVIENDERKCAHYPYPSRPCIEKLDYVINNRPDCEIRRVIRTGVKSEEIINKHKEIENDFKDNFSDWLLRNNCEDYIRKVTGSSIGTDQRIYALLVLIIIILIVIVIFK